MQIISVNVGQERELPGAKSGKTGIYKMPVKDPVYVSRLGLANDVIIDTKNHGGPDQAVYVYTVEDYRFCWARELDVLLEPGTFGENLTLKGRESARFTIGDRLYCGEVVLEVTAPRIPCVTLSRRMGDPEFARRFREEERPGFYCRVLQEGPLRAGMRVRYEPYRGEKITILEMFRNFYIPDYSEQNLRRYLSAPIAIRDREDKEARLQKLLEGRDG